MKLPKLRESVEIEFWSLRSDVGENLGVIFDVDTLVRRVCYRTKDGDTWRWQIKGLNQLPYCDCFADTDQECLNELGDSLEFEII